MISRAILSPGGRLAEESEAKLRPAFPYVAPPFSSTDVAITLRLPHVLKHIDQFQQSRLQVPSLTDQQTNFTIINRINTRFRRYL